MKLITRFLYLPAACIVLLASCAKEQTESYDKFEDQALEAYMTLKHPELLENLQTEGGFYVDVIEPGKADSKPVNDTICWVKFDFSGRDLNGNIALTRSAKEAKQLNKFTKYTHYVPYYRYCGDSNSGLMEGTYLAMRNTLHLGEEYAAKKGLDPEFLLREGTKVRIYMPSRVVGSGGVSGDGGYEGQYSLSAKRPLIMDIEICGIDKNPLEAEGSLVDAFAKANGGMVMYTKDGEDGTQKRPTDPADENHPYKPKVERWVSACDTVAQLYVNVKYNPAETGQGDQFTFNFTDAENKVDNKAYNVGYEPYNKDDMSALEADIAKVLKERFHGKDDDYKAYEGVDKLESDSVGLSGTAKIWYIGRFLDGFIFDTNIDEVKEIIYGAGNYTEGSAKSYKPEDGGDLTAWYYTVPNLRYGQWAAFVTTSTNAYGTNGRSGSSSSSSSNGNSYSNGYYDYLNYLNYSQGYYGNSGYYGGYYGDYYGYGGLGGYGYGGGYYGGYGYDYGSTDDSSTTTTVTTEIPSFAPLVYQFYIEPAED